MFPVVSNPFVDLYSNVESSFSGPPSFLEGGPVKLTRFVEMSSDICHATVNEMIVVGRFEHIGHASIREGTTAWGVWLRVDQWPTVLGRHPRLRCGVPYHVAKPFLFTGMDVTQCNCCCHSSRIGRILFSFSCPPHVAQVFVFILTVFRPVVPSHNVLHFSLPILTVPNLEVPSHNSVLLRRRLF